MSTPMTPVGNLSKWIRISRPFALPSFVKAAVQKLSEHGHVAYIVGGSVRDFLLGHEVKDYDLATSALPEELCEIFPTALTVGKAFGVIKVPTGGSPPLLEIATFREDLEYQNHRHPKGVVFAGPVQDAMRRDFTINAIYYDPKTRRILDITGGIDDLRTGVIRAIGNPNERFKEDALRLLRAIRFKTRFGFQLDPQTKEAIRARAHLLSKVSAERIRDELNLMWIGANPAESLQLLSELGLLPLVLQEVEALKKLPQIPSQAQAPQEDIWSHVLKVLRNLSQQSPHRTSQLSWAAVLHEVGKPIAYRMNHEKNYNGHEIEGTKQVEMITKRLRMSKSDSERIVHMVADHMKFKEVFQMRESTLQRFIRQDHFEDLLAFHRADAVATDGNLAFYEFCEHRLKVWKETQVGQNGEQGRLIDGTDLIQMGFQPGPEFSEILRVIEDLALEKKMATKEEALEYVLKHYVK